MTKATRKTGMWHSQQQVKIPGSHRHDEQAGNHGAFVTEPIDRFAPWKAEDEVGREKGELYQHRLRITQLENALQVWNDDVVQAS